ncbi:MAG: carbohydrate ABC transporter permease [Chloroflexota bacterium]
MTATGATRARRPNAALSRILFYVILAVILLYIIFPFYWAFRSAITPDKDLFATPVQYFPSNPTLTNFKQVLGDNQFLHSLLNSAIVAVSVTVLALIIGATASYALGRFRFRGRMPVMYLVLSMTMFPQVAVLGALWNMINQFGFYDHLYALILTYLVFTLPFTVWVLTSFFRAMPGELEEAAYVDGASPFQTFYKIMLPLVAPGLVTTGLLAFISAWNEFLYALSFLQSPENRTVPLAIFNFVPTTNVGSNFVTPWGQEMAATVVVTIPLVVLTLIFQRRILAGLTAGAVKG